MVVGETLIEGPVPTGVPPQLPEYHVHAVALFKLPEETESVVLLPAHILDEVALIEGVVGAVQGVEVPVTVTENDQEEEPPSV